MSDEAINNLAVKIARLVQAEQPGNDFYSLRESIEKINQRLGKIETTLDNRNSSDVHHSSFITHHSKPHPSLEKFAIDEAVAHQSNKFPETEKPCIFEPNGKPCDHCSMCNSRGF